MTPTPGQVPLIDVKDLQCLFPVRRGLGDVIARRHS